MSAPKKKRAGGENLTPDESIDEDSNGEEFIDDDPDEEEMEDDSEEIDEPDVQIDFEARNLDDSDFHGIRKLLQQLFLKANINVSEMTDTLISQNYIGSVIQQADQDMADTEEDSDDDLDIFGVTSVLNITERKGLECIKQLKAVLLEHCKQCAKGHVDKLAAILNDDSQQLGFILNERFINIPPQIAVPAFDSLWREAEAANKKKMKYKFSNYLLISKTYALPQAAAGAARQSKGSVPDTRCFMNAEEELFLQESSLSFDYSVKSERDMVVGGKWDEDAEEMEPLRTVMLVAAEKLSVVMERMRDLYAQPAT